MPLLLNLDSDQPEETAASDDPNGLDDPNDSNDSNDANDPNDSDDPNDPNDANDAVGPHDDGAPTTNRRFAWRVVGWLTSALAGLVVVLALNAPIELGRFSLGAFGRIPVEGLVIVALALVLPVRARQASALIAGPLLGLLIILKVFDLGFYATLDRPFDLVLDWHFLGNAMDYLTESINRAAAIGAAVGAVLLAVAILVLATWSVLRLTRVAVTHRSWARKVLAMLTVVWISAAALGAQFATGEPVAGRSALTLTRDNAEQVRSSLHDHKEFTAQAAVDRFRNTPNDQLLTGLAGKDVVLAVIESYGRSAVEDPNLAPGVDPILDAGTRQLQAQGFAAKSGWLTSSTAGGGSWFAHSTLLSGLWVNNQQRYNSLVRSDRLTLPAVFGRAGWRTVTVDPGTTGPWPQGAFYHYDTIYTEPDLGYQGPHFSWSPMPDQYTLAQFQRTELAAPDHPPVMAEIALTSSHAPWAPLPSMIDWKDVGNGSAFDAMPATGKRPADVWPDAGRVRTEYGRSIQYSLTALISYLETYGTKNTVLVFLGDHQPIPLVTGVNATRDVPITIVAKDPAVLAQISSWGWQDGLKPGPQAPVWPMSAFRDRFISAFSPAAK